MWFLFLLASWILFSNGAGPAAALQSTNSISLHPASIPVAVRSPFLSSWLTTLANSSSTPDEIISLESWTGHKLGWVGLIRVDGETYQWMGVAGVTPSTVLDWYITPTQTAFSIRAGAIDFNVTFLSPVEPTDLARLSFPFAYLSVDVVSRDGRDHEVQIYTDVTGEWIAPNLTDTTFASATRTQNSVYYSMQNREGRSMNIKDEVALDGTLILAAANTNAVTSQNGVSADVRTTFDRNGRLNNQENTAEISIIPDYPVIALSIDLGTIRNTPSPTPVVFALGVLRDPVIEYQRESSTETQTRRPYFFTRWATIQEAVDAFIADFPPALERADDLDTKIMRDAQSSGTERYASLVALTLRQTMASIEATIPVVDGKLDASDVKSFMRDVGETGRVNAVGTMYASLPALLYLNPSLIGTLLHPFLEAQALPSYPHAFAAPDLGSDYPKAGRNETNTTTLGVDSSSSMLIMALLHARKSGEGALLKRYYDLFKKWADFLVSRTLHPAQSASSDGFRGEDNANLALKGILALHAMGEISHAVGEMQDAQLYAVKAKDYYDQWQTLAFVGGRMVSSYSQSGSWALAYNLYASKLLGADAVTSQVYDGQTAFHRSQLSGGERYGVGYDSNSEYTVKSHWTMFTAATMTDNAVCDDFVSRIYNRTFMTGITPPFATTWDSRSGQTLAGIASPAQGAMFALLALKLPDLPIKLEAGGGGNDGSAEGSNPPSSTGRKSNVAPIVGGVIGGFAVLLLFLLAFIWRRQKQQKDVPEEVKVTGKNSSSLAPLPALLSTQQSSDNSAPSISRDRTGSEHLNPQPPSSTVFVKPRLPSPTRTTTSPVTLQSAGLSYTSPSPPSSRGVGNPVMSGISVESPGETGLSKGESVPALRQSGGPVAGEEAEELRAEVLALRREMELIRAQQAPTRNRLEGMDADGVPDEPPPSYS